jgi:hypothetical protein
MRCGAGLVAAGLAQACDEQGAFAKGTNTSGRRLQGPEDCWGAIARSAQGGSSAGATAEKGSGHELCTTQAQATGMHRDVRLENVAIEEASFEEACDLLGLPEPLCSRLLSVSESGLAISDGSVLPHEHSSAQSSADPKKDCSDRAGLGCASPKSRSRSADSLLGRRSKELVACVPDVMRIRALRVILSSWCVPSACACTPQTHSGSCSRSACMRATQQHICWQFLAHPQHIHADAH